MTVVVTTLFYVAVDVKELEDDALELVELLAAFPIVVNAAGFAGRVK
jgi:hypothetical protein